MLPAIALQIPMADNPMLAAAQGFWSGGDGLAQQWLSPNSHGLLLVQWDGKGPLHLSAPVEAQRLGGRLEILNRFAAAAAMALWAQRGKPVDFAVQVHDEAPDHPCFRFDAARAEAAGPATGLIPDPYALGSWGYATLREQFEQRRLPRWRDRLPVALWRGSTTGAHALTPQRLPQLPRYRLCQLSHAWPQWLDARITAVVQARDRTAQHQIETQLVAEGLLAPRCEPWDAALHRWLIEIDGNVNSWGLLWKLLSGSCVLRVESARCQWYHHRLEPWRHVVPISADLADLPARLQWCHANPAQCEAIAAAGQALARQVVADLELDMLAAVHSALP